MKKGPLKIKVFLKTKTFLLNCNAGMLVFIDVKNGYKLSASYQSQ